MKLNIQNYTKSAANLRRAFGIYSETLHLQHTPVTVNLSTYYERPEIGLAMTPEGLSVSIRSVGGGTDSAGVIDGAIGVRLNEWDEPFPHPDGGMVRPDPIIKTFGHEFTHVWQSIIGKLVRVPGGGHVYDRKFYSKHTPYFVQPWEVEARNVGGLLYQKYLAQTHVDVRAKHPAYAHV